MPSVEWNSAIWGRNYDWGRGGEEWSRNWGGSEPQWFGALYPRLHRFLPAGAILEIAPGFGRWTKFLLPACTKYLGIDLSPKCVESCRSSFVTARHAVFLSNDGLSLKDAPDGMFDLIFSFNSLVHAEQEVMESYIPQILQKLTPTGVSFLHHSNFASLGEGKRNPHLRAKSVSGEKLTELITKSEGKILVQEMINWCGNELNDCMTLFGKTETYANYRTVNLINLNFMDEAKIISEYQRPYSIMKSISY